MRNRRHAAKPYLATWASARPGHKVCRACNEELPVADFGPRKVGKDGLMSWCRKCTTTKKRGRRAADPHARAKERAYEQRADVATRTRTRRAARLYEVPAEQLQAMEAEQQGRCAVCGRQRKLAVDHCHLTGAVRGLLCYPCNIALGQVDDDVERLRQLIAYVKRYRTTRA
jgi:hypothetical protein